jgi:uncharacterized protein (TIGR02466 family)|tara:strand:- start:659 stop:1285 length:627 start_codon:yes stop_codon:yes gene_type:complete
MKEELLQIFPTPLLIVPYEESIDKELAYLKTISYREQKQNGNFRSDDSYLLRNEEFKNIKTFLSESVDKFTKNVLNSKQRLVITQCWANRNPKGSKHHEHVHPNSIISGVMYFQMNEKLPPIQFAKSIQDGVKLDPIKYNHVNAESFMLPCKPGELILFPSSLKHSVPINVGDEDRISVSFNTFSIDVLGSEQSLTHLDVRRLMNEHN